MLDMDQLIRELEKVGGSETQNLLKLMRSPNGQKIASNLSPQDAALIERAAGAFAKGDMNTAKNAAMQLMNNPDSAAIINQILGTMK